MKCPVCGGALVVENGDEYRTMYFRCANNVIPLDLPAEMDDEYGKVKPCDFEIDALEDVPQFQEAFHNFINGFEPRDPEFLSVWWKEKKEKEVAEAQARRIRLEEMKKKSDDEAWERERAARQQFHEHWQKMSYFEKLMYRIRKDWGLMWDGIEDKMAIVTREQWQAKQDARQKEAAEQLRKSMEKTLWHRR